MAIKEILVTLMLGLTLTISFVPDSAALSANMLLSDKVDESTLVIVGVVSDSRSLFEDSSVARLGKIYKIKIEKVIKGEPTATEILIYKEPFFSTQSAMCFEGGRYLMFLKEIAIKPELLNKTKTMIGDELELLKQATHYTVVAGAQGSYYLGLDATLAKKYNASGSTTVPTLQDKHSSVKDKYKASKQEQYKLFLKQDHNKLSEKVRSQKYLQSTEEFTRITKIKDEGERENAWRKVLDGNDETLKKSARVKMGKAFKK